MIMQEEIKSKNIEKFAKENNVYVLSKDVYLTAKDVQYDMVKYLDKNFFITGTAELSEIGRNCRAILTRNNKS